jgi:ribosomal protein S12 methylthiotransferase accessory factor
MTDPSLPQHPIVKRHLRVETIPPGDVFLIGERERHVLRGRAFCALLPLLDGRNSIDDIVAALDGTISQPEIWYALERLRRDAILTDAYSCDIPAEQAAYWHTNDVNVETAAARLKSLRVAILPAIGAVDVAPLRDELAQFDCAIVGAQAKADIAVVLTDDYLQAGIERLNRDFVDRGQTWVLAKPLGHTLWLGPIMTPGESNCWACLAERIRLNRQVEDFVIRKKNYDGPLPKAGCSLPSTQALAAAILTSEIARWRAGAASRIDGALLTFDTRTARARLHAVTRRPQCPVCGNPERYRLARPTEIRAVPKQARAEGGHRSASPEETFARFQHTVSPITGVVSWLENFNDHVSDLIYSFTAGHNFVMGQDTLDWLQQGLRTRTGGKGITEIQAKVSAIGEAIERYSGVYRGDEYSIRSSRRALGDKAIELDRCLNFSPRQTAERARANGHAASILHRVPNPLDETIEIEWTPVWSLTTQEFRYLPAAYCWYGHPDSREHFFSAGDTNGCAAGATREEAILQAFLELVERDAVAIWWYNRLTRPGVDLASFGSRYLDRLTDYYRGIGREFWVLDLTADLAIPTFGAISRRTDRPVEDIVFGFGAHLDPALALQRAVSELNQFLPAVLRTDAEGRTIYAWPEDEAVRWWRNETLATQPYLCPDASAPLRRYADFRRFDGDDIGDEVRTCVDLCRRAGLEFFVQDQTRPDIGMNVYRVIVPGLRHFWRRLGPGRLYDIPVKLGWLDRPTPEHALNPISIFI